MLKTTIIKYYLYIKNMQNVRAMYLNIRTCTHSDI